MAFAALHDTVIVESADDLRLTVAGPLGESLAATLSRAARDNLVIVAARRLADAAGIRPGAHIRLIKRLPVAAGIGGGSADAAATLLALVRLWGVSLGQSEMAALALDLGADVPMCLAGRAALMGGIGERLTPIDALPSAGLVLVNPGAALATADVFRRWQGPFSPPANVAVSNFNGLGNAAALAGLVAPMGNDLAAPAASLAPTIEVALAALAASPGSLLARMSGSGATCFGLYPNPGAAAVAARALALARPDWWIAATSLIADTGCLDPALDDCRRPAMD